MRSATFWDKAAAKYARAPISDMAAYQETLQKIRAVLRPEDRVLEIGGGTGSTALELAGGVADYLGTDISPNMIDIARAKVPPDGASLRFEVASAEALPEGEFDVVIALNLLHLLDDSAAVLQQIFGGLPKGGRLITKTVLLKEAPFYIRALIPPMRALGKAPYVRNLDEATVLDEMTRAGFNVTQQLRQGGTVPRLFTVAEKM